MLRRSGCIRLPLLAALVLALSPAVSSAAAHTIAGTVTDTSGNAIAGLTVTATPAGGGGAVSDTTGGHGGYSIGGLSGGSYTVEFDGDQSQNDVAEDYPQSVDAGANPANIDASLTPGASISGTVSGAVGGEDVTVTVSSPGGTCPVLSPCDVATDAGGHYTITGLPRGNYFLQAAPNAGQNYLTQYFAGASGSGEADPIGIDTGQAGEGADFAMLTGGQITGQVTDGSGTPVKSVDVTAVTSDGSLGPDAVTDADGDYTITGLTTGSYTLEFQGKGYLPVFDGGGSTSQGARYVTVTQGQTSGPVDASLLPAGAAAAITGTVTSAANGLPVGGVAVQAYDTAGDLVAGGAADTAGDGTYSISGLLPGAYTLRFAGPGLLAFQFSGGATTLATATPVTVGAGATAHGIDAALTTGGSVTGQVTDATTHAPVAGIPVELVDGSGFVLDSADTRPDGTYSIAGVPTGSYHVEFVGSGAALSGGGAYADQFWSGHLTLSGSDAVPVTAGTTTGGVDAGLQTTAAATAPVIVNTVTIVREVAVAVAGTPSPSAPAPRSKPKPTPKAGPARVSAGRLSGLGAGRPSLGFAIASGDHGAPRVKSFTVGMPKGLYFLAKGLGRGLRVTGGGGFTHSVHKGVLHVTLRGSATRLSVAIASRALAVTRALATRAKAGRVAALRVNVVVTDTRHGTRRVALIVRHPR